MIIQPNLAGLPHLRESGATKEMLSLRPLGAGKLHCRINSSSLSVLQTCFRKAKYLLEDELRSRVESPATLFGSAVHKALEVFYTGKREDRELPAKFATDTDLLLSGELRDDYLVYRAMSAFLTHHEPLRALPESDKRSASAGLWLLRNYFETYINDPFVVLCDESGPITERTCSALLYDSRDLRIEYFGTIDVVLENAQTGVIVPTDHKTSSVVGSDFYNRLKPNHQYSGYIWLAREALGLEVDTFLVNCLQVKPRPTTSRGQPPHFPRQPTRRTAEDLEEFKESVVWTVRRYLQAREASTWPLGDVNACAMYGGCTYRAVCEAPSALRPNIIEATFQGKDIPHGEVE